MPNNENTMTGEEQVKEFEDQFPQMVLEISRSRRQAQNDLMAIVAAENAGTITQMQAHERLMNPTTQTERELSLEAGYNIVFSGLSFSGYAVGPLMLGGRKGQEIAQARGSYNMATGLLTNETLEGATLYASHICSYVEYDFGTKKIKVTDPGSGNPVIEEEPS